jgi:hypothetical protein
VGSLPFSSSPSAGRTLLSSLALVVLLSPFSVSPRVFSVLPFGSCAFFPQIPRSGLPAYRRILFESFHSTLPGSSHRVHVFALIFALISSEMVSNWLPKPSRILS